jgi:cysteinyl-tRNA synthetase
VYVAFDTLLRSLRRHGYDVTCVPLRAVRRSVALAYVVRSRCSRAARRTRARSYVRNFTDVDDKIIRRAAEVRALLSPPASSPVAHYASCVAYAAAVGSVRRAD